jgi:hypothetical protein
MLGDAMETDAAVTLKSMSLFSHIGDLIYR